MDRLTRYDAVRRCYVIEPDSTTNHIQRLGELEDRDEAKGVVCSGEKYSDGSYDDYSCPNCKHELEEKNHKDDEDTRFCPWCGQSIKWYYME